MGRFIDENLGWFIFGFIFLSLIGVVVLCVAVDKEEKRLLNQCMADGHKEYECHSMFDNHHQVTPVPIIIPMR